MEILIGVAFAVFVVKYLIIGSGSDPWGTTGKTPPTQAPPKTGGNYVPPVKKEEYVELELGSDSISEEYITDMGRLANFPDYFTNGRYRIDPSVVAMPHCREVIVDRQSRIVPDRDLTLLDLRTARAVKISLNSGTIVFMSMRQMEKEIGAKIRLIDPRKRVLITSFAVDAKTVWKMYVTGYIGGNVNLDWPVAVPLKTAEKLGLIRKQA